MLVRGLILLVAFGAGLYALLCAGVWLFQERLVFFPGPPPRQTPAVVGLPYEEVELVTSDDVRLHAWYLPTPGADAAVLVSHGNGGTIEHRLHLAQAFVGMGHAVLLYDYRGYGQSAGRPEEAGTYLDAEAAYDFLIAKEFAPERVVSYGESLGGAVALELALRRDVGALVTESAFTSVLDMGEEVYPWLPVRLLGHIEYDSLAKIERVDVPYLAIHSPADEIVPVAHGRALFARAPEPKAWLETSGGHNDGGFPMSEAARAAVARFLDQSLN